MCTADVPQFLNPSAAAAHAKTRFAMKLPRLNRASSSRAHKHQAEEATPRPGPAASDSRDGGMRRSWTHPSSRSCPVQRAPSPRPGSQGRPASASTRTSRAVAPTREVPVPEGARRRRAELARSADRSDLARMYDYATWSMYERIVDARRQRLQSRPGPTGGTRGPTAGGSRPAKTSSHGDESTTDETDRSSAASSSWSRENSPMAFPRQAHLIQGIQSGGGVPAFPHLDPRGAGVHSCPPPMRDVDPNEDDSFIFQLDM